MTFYGTKLTFRLTPDSRGDKASPMRRGTSATEGAWQNRGSPREGRMKLGHASSSSSAFAPCSTGVVEPFVARTFSDEPQSAEASSTEGMRDTM